LKESDVVFVCVGTPSNPDGSINASHVEKTVKDLGACIKNKKEFCVIVIKSTVIPGETTDVLVPLLEKYSDKTAGKGFGVCVNPEFLREGSAIYDFVNPDRIIIGEYDKKSGDILENLYKNFGSAIMRTDLKTAEMIKYGSNAFLAAKVTLINEIGNICKKLNIDVYDVAKGIGYDRRIGNTFLSAGIGFGGSCFSKDIKALQHKAKTLGYHANVLESILKLNEYQRIKIIDILKNKIPKLEGKVVSVLGLAFKANTDDIRDSPAVEIVSELKKYKCKIVAYDPKASENFRKICPDIIYAKSSKDALRNADACLILTEWDEFKNLSDKDFSDMKNKIIIEGRHVLNKDKVKDFEGICW
jgi:UDPglucose 6-dehydrogenase